MTDTALQTHPAESTILSAVRAMYEEVAVNPERKFHFPTGRGACLFVGYPEELVDRLPTRAVESFAGVGFPFRGAISAGDTVVDVGSGSGVDVIVSAMETGPEGRVIGIDMTPAMIKKARQNVAEAGLTNVEIREGSAERLPLEDESADVVTSNGVINLAPDKARAFREIARVLRPGGRLQLADIVLRKPASDASKANPQLWAECVVGAEPGDHYLTLIRNAGFEDITEVDTLEYFEGSPNDETRKAAGGLGAHTIVITARKPE